MLIFFFSYLLTRKKVVDRKWTRNWWSGSAVNPPLGSLPLLFLFLIIHILRTRIGNPRRQDTSRETEFFNHFTGSEMSMLELLLDWWVPGCFHRSADVLQSSFLATNVLQRCEESSFLATKVLTKWISNWCRKRGLEEGCKENRGRFNKNHSESIPRFKNKIHLSSNLVTDLDLLENWGDNGTSISCCSQWQVTSIKDCPKGSTWLFDSSQNTKYKRNSKW